MKKLDWWITEEVMGGCIHKNIERINNTQVDYLRCKDCGAYGNSIATNYTTSIELAFKAAEEICGKHGHLNVDRVGGITTCIISGGPRKTTEDAEHKNSATAVCLAIFKLTTGEDWEENS